LTDIYTDHSSVFWSVCVPKFYRETWRERRHKEDGWDALRQTRFYPAYIIQGQLEDAFHPIHRGTRATMLRLSLLAAIVAAANAFAPTSTLPGLKGRNMAKVTGVRM
jgi:hypothetical protein